MLNVGLPYKLLSVFLFLSSPDPSGGSPEGYHTLMPYVTLHPEIADGLRLVYGCQSCQV